MKMLMTMDDLHDNLLIGLADALLRLQEPERSRIIDYVLKNKSDPGQEIMRPPGQEILRPLVACLFSYGDRMICLRDYATDSYDPLSHYKGPVIAMFLGELDKLVLFTRTTGRWWAKVMQESRG